MGHLGMGIYGIGQAFEFVGKTLGRVVTDGFAFNRTMEDAIAGLNALTVASASNVASTGRLVDVAEKYRIANQTNLQVLKEL